MLEMLVSTGNPEADTTMERTNNSRIEANILLPAMTDQDQEEENQIFKANEVKPPAQKFYLRQPDNSENKGINENLEAHKKLHARNSLLYYLENKDDHDTEECQENNQSETDSQNKELKALDYKSYMDLLEFRVPLQKLYKIIASCHHTEGTDFCGLLVQVMDNKIIKKNNGKEWLV